MNKREYLPDTFDCECCGANNVPLNQLERSDLDVELCYCSQACKDADTKAMLADRAHKRLIAAAPELLEALKLLKSEVIRLHGGYAGQALEGATAAIAKAEGEEK